MRVHADDQESNLVALGANKLDTGYYPSGGR